MKIRITDDSIRLRITPSELERLLSDKEVKTTIGWMEEAKVISITFVVKPSNDTYVNYVKNTNTYIINWISGELQSWGSSIEVGLYQDFNISAGQNLSLAIEKDFECKGRKDEDKSDRFPNTSGTNC